MLREAAAQLAFEFIRDLSVQLITLATGVTAVTIAAAERGMLERISARARATIRMGWVLCLISVATGILQLMALTGALAPPDGAPPLIPEVPGNARLFGLLQILTFALGMIAMVAFAWRGIASGQRASAPVPALEVVAESPHRFARKRERAKRS